MKTSKLFITSLLAAAAMSATAFGATATLTSTTTTISESDAGTYGIAAGTYSGNIIELTAAGSTGFHDGTFTIYNTDASGTISTTAGVTGTTSTALTNGGTAGSSQTLWNYFVGSGSTLSSNYTYGETLYVSATTLSSGDLTANMTFGPAALGGLVVGASDNTFETGRNNADIQMQFAGASGSGVVFNIASNTKLHAGSGFVASGSQSWSIASGKTLSLLNQTSGGGTLTLNENCTIEVSGGGILSVGGIVASSGATLTIGTDTSLNLSGGTVTLASAIANSGTVTVNANTIFVLSDSLKVGDTGNTYSLISGGNITDWNTLTASNFRIGSGPNSLRGASADVSTDGQVAFTAGTAANLTWKGSASTTWDVQGAQNWTNDSTSSADVFYDYDSVTFDASTTGTTTNIAAGVTVTDLTISGGTHTFTVSSGAYVKITGTASVENGATLILGSSTGGTGLLRGAVTVRSGGELQFTANDLTGYNGGANSLSSITIDAGGTLYLNHSQNETFAGTLTLNGTLKGSSTSSRFDLYSGSTLTVSANQSAVVDKVWIRLRRDNPVITVGANATLTLSNGAYISNQAGNGQLSKNGAGALVLDGGASSVVRLNIQDSGSVELKSGSLTVSDTAEGLYVRGGSTFKVSGGTATIGRLVLNAAATSNNAANVEVTGGVLNVTSTAPHGVILGSYGGTATHQLSVSGDGVFNAIGYAMTVAYASNGKISVSGGEMNVKGFVFSGQNNKNSTLEVTGGRLNIGASGITQAGTGTKTVSFSNATIGALDSWTGASAITLGGTVIFDTTKMVASTTGKSSADATDTAGTTIELSGKISGSGTLKKIGAGTLKLSGANDFTGNIEIAEGVVVTTRPYSLGLEAATVKLSGGQLQVNASENGAIVQTAISIVLSDAYSSTAAITGDGALATGTTITIEDLALATVAEAALQNQYSFQIATADTTITSSLTAGSFMFSEALRSDWQISDYTNGVLTIAAIPEPSTFGLLAGLGALALAGTRRRRRKA